MFEALIPVCAPDVAPNTVTLIIIAESQGDPLAINVNGLGKKVKASSQREAADLTRHYMDKGFSVDVGLMQVNSSNFARLGYNRDRIEELFEPCNNIAAGSEILKNFFARSKEAHPGDTAKALRGAISAYNTGSFTRGISNGYVGKVYKNVGKAAPTPDNSQAAQALRAPTGINLDAILTKK